MRMEPNSLSDEQKKTFTISCNKLHATIH